MNSFKKLNIDDFLLKVIEEEHFEEPTDIQKKSIPKIIQGLDIIAGSATGSGKTLAFGAGILHKAKKGKGIQALVLTPTRELAEQVTDSLKTFSRHKPLRILSVYGGVSINPQIEKLSSSEIVVGTPGRILDHLQRKTIDLSKIISFVLDEADRMLDMGFIEDVEKIIKACPRERQTLLFSATIPPTLFKLAKKYMRDPVEVSVKSQVDPKKLRQVYYDVKDHLKFSLLAHLLKQDNIKGLVMVFCNTQKMTDAVAKTLKNNGLKAQAIHGGFSQTQRNRTLDFFHEGKTHILVCTDVAARGLHIENVSHVYNFDIPIEPKQYVHRIGRTARAGKDGIAINLLSPRDHELYRKMIADTGIKVEKVPTPHVEFVPLKFDSFKKRRKPSFRTRK